MRRSLLILLFILANASVKCQDFSQEKAIIDREVSSYIEKGLFLNASDLLVNFATNLENNGDTLSALHYQLENCKLIDSHIDYFLHDHNYLNWEGYFSNWYVTISMMGWLNKKQEAIPYLFNMLNLVWEKVPELLPFYASDLSFILDDCTIEQYRDSIYILQKSLDVIKDLPPSRNLIKQYIRISSCFNRNRFYNSIEGVLLKYNRFQEIRKWHTINSPYINNLDVEEYGNEIIEYEVEYADLLFVFASTASDQENNPLKAISLYEEEISILTPLLSIDSGLSQKIAACHANISKDYYQLGDLARSKEFNDYAIRFLVNHKDNYEFCDILSSISLNFYNINNSQLAAQFKLTEILTRERLGWHCSQSDWGSFFTFAVNHRPSDVLLYKDIALKADKKYRESYSLFLNIGNAYSSLMNNENGFKDSAEYYFRKAESIVNTDTLFNHSRELLDLTKYSIDRSWAGHFLRLGDSVKSYHILKNNNTSSYKRYHDIAFLASSLHDVEGIHEYLPKYFYNEENKISKMLPVLGSTESDIYLDYGNIDIYHISEWASWNPTDSVSVSIAYDAALFTKGLTLRYNVLTPYYNANPEIELLKHKLDRMRDSIYIITNDEHRFLALYQYEQAERDILKKINNQLINTHWQDIREHLDESNICLEFVKYTTTASNFSTHHYAAILLSKGSHYPIFVDLFDESELYETYTLQPKSYDTETGTRLYKKLWGKLNSYIAGKRQVFFSPAGLLNLINIEALVDSSGINALEKYNLLRVSSTKQIVSSIKESPIKSVVSYGGIDYAEVAEVIDSLNTRGNWNYLKSTLTEVYNVAELLQKSNIHVTTITGSNATETSFKTLDGTTANIIHIASHGFYIPAQQREGIPYYANSAYTQTTKDELFYSGLIMSGGQMTWMDSTFKAEKNDGVLTSYEISKLDLHNVDLVVLSACETGLGDDLFDGIFGLQRAFKKAGVKSILMSLWQIDDKATSEYMELFYGFLTSGLSKQESYKRTVAEMKKRYQDANYWASFILLD